MNKNFTYAFVLLALLLLMYAVRSGHFLTAPAISIPARERSSKGS